MKKLIFFLSVLLLAQVRVGAQCTVSNMQDPIGNTVVLNYECPAGGFSLNANYNGVIFLGDAWVKPAPGNTINRLKKPLIFVEGLDLDTVHHSQHRHGSRGWPNFISGVTAEGDTSESGFKLLPDLNKQLLKDGYDLIFLDFTNGTREMQGNALVLVDLIQKVSANFDPQSAHSIVVIGASMGGQIAKYAISYMEKNNIKHCVRDYISFDSPHLGANIPLGIQAMVGELAPLLPDLQKFKDLMNTKAPMQLLVNHINPMGMQVRQNWLNDLNAVGNYPKRCRKVAIANGSGTAQELFQAGSVMADFKLGTLSPCNNNLVVEGKVTALNDNGLPNLLFEGKLPSGFDLQSMLANVQACDLQCQLCKLNPNIFFNQPTFGVTPNMRAYDNAPGGYRTTLYAFGYMLDRAIEGFVNSSNFSLNINYFTKMVYEDKHSFIPTISALDINAGNLLFNVHANMPSNTTAYPAYTQFDACYSPVTNEPHVQVTGDSIRGNIGWTLRELAANEPRAFGVISAASPNNGVYNYKRKENNSFGYLSIENGGKVYVNAELPSDFGAASANSIPSFSLDMPAFSTLNVESCYCTGSMIEVKSGGKLILGDSLNSRIGNLIFHAGSKFVLRSGGTLVINEGSTLLIEPNAQFILEPGAVIYLKGPNALLDAQGEMLPLNLNSTQSLQVLRGSSPVGGTVKLSSGTMRMKSNSHFIVDNCKVYLNNVVFTYEQDADFTLNGENSLIDVKSTCNISIASGHQMVVKKTDLPTGGTLLFDNGTFELFPNAKVESDYCKIRFNDYVSSYYQNADIELNGDEATLQYGGLLHLMPQAELKFRGEGYLGFKLNYMPNGDINLFGDASNKIILEGIDPNDKVAEVLSRSYVKADDDLMFQSIQHGRIEFGTESAWLLASSYKISNLTATSINGESGDGFWVCAVPNHSIDDIHFVGLNKGISAYLMWGNASILRINNCRFENCYQGIKFVDKGLILNDIDFKDCHLPIEGIGASVTSSFSNIDMHDLGSTYDFGMKLSSAGTAAFYMQNITIRDGINGAYLVGISIDGTSLSNMKCSKIYAYQNSIVLHNYASLNLSPLVQDPTNGTGLKKFGGNNNFHSAGGLNAFFSNLLILQDGMNDFSVDYAMNPGGLALSGSTFSWINPPGTSLRLLPAHNNKWYDEPAPYVTSPNHNNTGIPLAVMHKGGGGSGMVQVVDDSPNFKECGTGSEPVLPVVPNEVKLPISYCPKCPVVPIDSTHVLSMSAAFQQALLNSLDTTNPAAMENAYWTFYAIANTATTFDEDRIDWNGELAYLKMKELFSSLLQAGKINPLQESNPICSALIEMEKRYITMSKEKDDDLREFYFSVDLATTYRLLGKYTAALEELNRLAPCLQLQVEQVNFLNQWISQIQTEQSLLSGAIGIFDFDTYNGMNNSGNREFQKFGNVQANIDTIMDWNSSAILPESKKSVQDQAGNSYSISSQVENGNCNFWLKKSDVKGNVLWEQGYDGRNHGVDSAMSIAIDDNQRIYVSGKSWNGFDFDVLTIKYDTSGNQYWVAKYNDRSVGNDEPLAFEVDEQFKLKVYLRSYNDTLSKYRVIYYSQCDSNCAQNYQIKNAQYQALISDEASSSSLSVYPNPTKDKINLAVRDALAGQQFDFSLYDMRGSLVMSRSISSRTQIDVVKLIPGVYQIVVKDGKNYYTQRLVKE